MAALGATDKERCRYHLGYLQVEPAASLQFGLPRPIPTVFLVETAMNNIIAEAVPRVQRLLQVLDGIEAQLVAAICQLKADGVGNIKLAGTLDPKARLATDRLEAEYKRWACRLADTLGVPLYAFSRRFRGGAGSVPVRG